MRDFGYIKLVINLLYCSVSGFELMEICKGMILASAECALQYGVSLTVEASVLQQCVRLQPVRNTQLCKPVCVYREWWFAKILKGQGLHAGSLWVQGSSQENQLRPTPKCSWDQVPFLTKSVGTEFRSHDNRL